MTNLQHLRSGELSSRMILSARRISATCFNAFLNVFKLCAQVKVKRITTRSNVTTVEDVNSFWNWSVIQAIGNSVSLIYAASVPHIPVTIFIQRPVVQPATIINQHARLESFAERFPWRLNDARESAKATMTASTGEMTDGIVSAICIEVQMRQTHAKLVVAFVANIEVPCRSFEVEPNPSRSINGTAVLGEHGSSTVVCASSPDFARTEFGCERRSVSINVLVEPEKGMYEFYRHNGSFVVFSGARRDDDLPSVATLAKFPVKTQA